MAAAVGAYRKILRALKKHVVKKDPSKAPFTDFVAQQFRSNREDKVLVNRKLQLALDYATLLNSVHYHKELLFSYNIAVDRTVEQKARIQNTAERVGLRLPKLETELDEEPSKSATNSSI